MFGNLFSAGFYFNGSYIIYEGNVIFENAYSKSQLLNYGAISHCGLIFQGIFYACYSINTEYFSLLNNIYNIDNYVCDISKWKNQNIYLTDAFFLI